MLLIAIDISNLGSDRQLIISCYNWWVAGDRVSIDKLAGGKHLAESVLA